MPTITDKPCDPGIVIRLRRHRSRNPDEAGVSYVCPRRKAEFHPAQRPGGGQNYTQARQECIDHVETVHPEPLYLTKE